MASEITVSAALSFRKGASMGGIDAGSVSITWTGTNWLQHRQIIGTSEEAILLGDVAPGGLWMAINRDATNYVILKGATAGQALIRLMPGEPAIFRHEISSTAPFAQANGAPVEVEFLLLEP